MPIYEYQCEKCGKKIEVIQKMSDKPLKKHEQCGGALTKLISASGFQFKGTGWYVTDYARKGHMGEAARTDKGEGAASKETGKETAGGSSDKAPAATTSKESSKTEATKSSDSKPSKSSAKKD